MKVIIIGGGPAGLYLSLLLKKADPAHRIAVLERNGPDDTFGWGVVFSDQTLGNFAAADPETCREIADHFARWDDIDVHVKGTVVTSGGHGFSGIARRTLLSILQRRAAGLGVELHFHCEVRGLEDLGDPDLGLAGRPDLVVAADGVNSVLRRQLAAHFQPDLDVRSAKYVWLGTTRLFDAFTFLFVDRPPGIDGVFQAHAYRFDERHSAFIVECDQASWRAAGFDRLDLDGTVAACERLFAPWLDGHPLLANVPPHQRAAPWQSFTRVRNAHWHHDKVVLIGDAAHTAHFSIGSGTKLAMEDAIALARVLASLGAGAGGAAGSGGHDAGGEDAARGGAGRECLGAALAAYEEERKTEALRLQNAARNSMEWFENVRRYIGLEPQQFAYSLLTRSQRVSHENLRQRDRAYLGGVERWFASRAAAAPGAASGAVSGAASSGPPGTVSGAVSGATPNWAPGAVSGAAAGGAPSGATGASGLDTATAPGATPPMFTPFRLRGLTLANRVVVSPMDMYSAQDGTPNDFHLVHLGARALGGAGLVITEMTCVSPAGRITPGCTGMYAEAHAAAWRRIVDFVHAWSRAAICLQLGHSGGKGSTRLMWEGMDEPLTDGGWEVMAASPVAYRPGMQVPREMTRADMDEVLAQFVRATHWALAAGFDMLELHCAHGYLLSGFITPLLNRRGDEYGGPLANRLRFPLEVFSGVRAAWPAERPMSVRISATDWVEEGLSGEEAVLAAAAFHHAGADIVHISTGQTAAAAQPVYGRMFQTPWSDRIRNEAGVPTIAVGNITEPDQVNSIVTAGRADLCALARPHLTDPHWTLRAAAELGFADQAWPVQYLTGKSQLERAVAQRGRLGGIGETVEMRGTSTV
ncbi:MAG TPA: bifunctional salicylyl-CoA 5-hydroxylase/oxidoreductase [Thermoanaerobaculia bacterium]|nr:bifunctional salicylyl-CoA 5-hydroxylase/oxidoreductase [Thermoanaerobaculia bacterium]